MDITTKKYLEIIKLNNQLKKSDTGTPVQINILGNITINKIKDILELPLRNSNLSPEINIGNYDNFLQDSSNVNNGSIIIVFQEVVNFFPNIESESLSWDEDKITSIINDLKNQLVLAFNNLSKSKLVIFNRFTAKTFTSNSLNIEPLDKIAAGLNTFLDETSRTMKNIRVVDIDKVITKIGINESIDLTAYSMYKDLYRPKFFIEYVNLIQHLIYSVSGKVKKALILDCDNTLWKGVLGEDGIDGIEMSPETKHGLIFNHVQQTVLSLAKKGILICLCSKNNPEDVNELIKNHSDFIIPDEVITLKKVNWQDKASNIGEIASELNIGTDSFVFIDDSDFEVNLVREKLPEVETFQVPKNLYDYSAMMKNVANYFYRNEVTKEDLNKSQDYKNQAKRSEGKTSFSNIEDYIKSLEIKVDIHVNEISHLQRMEQMAQKTNQFNFTTIRHTENEISAFINSPHSTTYSISVQDKFGDSGITGLIITKTDDSRKTATLVTFLMSCRVIGRNIEYAFLQQALEDLREKGIETLHLEYIPTKKNILVKDFYETLGLKAKEKENGEKSYKLNIKKFSNKDVSYIEVKKHE